jgi:hypothetical protein
VGAGGDNGQGFAAMSAKVSDRFTKAASRTNADFTKGYGYASTWKPGTPLVSLGSAEFESGVYAGMADNPGARPAFQAAHRRQARKDARFATRMQVHAQYTEHLASKGIDVQAANTPFGSRDACSKCGTDIEYVGHRPDPAKEFLKIDRGSGWWDRGGNFSCPSGGTHERGKTAATSTDLDTMDSSASPSPTGQTPINGPGTVPPLAGQADPAAPGGPAPYNGAEPFGAPAVPTGVPAPTPGNHYINDIPGGPVDGNVNPATLAFRRTVQAAVLADRKKKG